MMAEGEEKFGLRKKSRIVKKNIVANMLTALLIYLISQPDGIHMWTLGEQFVNNTSGCFMVSKIREHIA